MADSNFYESSFGDLRLFLSRISTDKSRSQVKHDPSAGANFVVQDRGPVILVSRCSVLFDYMRGDDLAPLARLRKLEALVDDNPRLFSHPVEGTFLARVGPFNYDIDASGVITADVEFTQVAPVEAVSTAGAGTIPASGVGAVSVAADALTAELAGVGMTSTLAADAITAVDAWATSDNLNPREVLAQTGSLTSKLGALADTLDGDIELWSAFKAVVLLAESVRAAAEVMTSETAQTFIVRVGSTVALRALLASIYPADEADLRYDQAMKLNDLISPAWIEPGTELELPQLSPRARIG